MYGLDVHALRLDHAQSVGRVRACLEGGEEGLAKLRGS